MRTPKLNSFKVRERTILRKKGGLTREIETLWSRKIPKKAGTAIAWSVLSHLVSDLSEHLDSNLLASLLPVIADQDVLGYLKLGAEWTPPQKHGSPGGYFSATSVFNLLKKFPWVDDRVDPLVKAVSRFRGRDALQIDE